MEPTLILGRPQREFFFQAIALSHHLHNQLKCKLGLFYGFDEEISSTILLAEILYKSEFGDHPLAQPFYPKKSTKFANNLTLLEVDSSWEGKKLKWDGKEYKSFESFDDFCVHWTDLLTFRRGMINNYLISADPPNEYSMIIENYRLGDFEIGNGKDK